MLKLPDRSKVEVFGLDSGINRPFTTGPVAGFLVDNIQAATAGLRSAGVEILFESELDDSGNAWVHFCVPDDKIYVSPRTLASPDRTEADGDGRSRRRGSPPWSRATWDK